MTLSVANFWAMNGRTTDETINLKGSDDDLIKVLSWNLTGGTEENHKKTS
jgi:hypothetical protein